VTHGDLFVSLETFYDAVPRQRARAEEYGNLVLFVPDGFVPGGGVFPLYARPRPGAGTPTAGDVTTVRGRQRDLGLPEAFEWVHDNTPDFLEVAEAAGLSVLHAPLLVLDPAALPETPPGVRILDPQAGTFGDELAVRHAVAHVAFGAPGTAVGASGTSARDAAVKPMDADRLRGEVERAVAGQAAHAVAEVPGDGVVASGVYQRAGAVAEIVGVATLPAARRRGLGAAVTVALARHALDHGATTVFLSAAEEAVARVYARVGFRRIGTACIAEPPSP